MLASLTNTSAYLLYVFAPLAILAVIFSVSVRRVFRERPAQFWLGFVVWMILAVPLSSWKGGSFTHVQSYVKSNFILLPVIACLATKWSDCRKIIYIIAAAAVFDLAVSYFFLKSTGDRLVLQWSGTIGNSNDLAAHLLVVLPFLLFVALKPRTRLLFRFALFAAIAFGIFQILSTGSRGALIALVATILFMLVRGSVRQKLVVGVAAAALVIMTAFLPETTWTRLTSFSKTGHASEEAMESSDLRQRALQESIAFTLQHPLFGVGPRQFPSYEDITMSKLGKRGNWLETHNSYTEVSSECGIPALIFYLAAILSTFALLAKIRKHAVGPHRKEIVTAAFCITLALFAYSVATFFVNFAYQFQFLAISGLVVAMWITVRNDRRRLSHDARHPQTPAHSPGMELVGITSDN